jgi:PAS domain S-box-containing protein
MATPEQAALAWFESSKDAVFALDATGNFQRANGALADLLHCPLSQLLGTSWLDYLALSDVAHAPPHLAQATAGELVRFRAQLHRPTPGGVEFTLLPWLAEGSRPAGIYGIVQPVAAPIPAERERQLEVFFDAVTDVTFVLGVEPAGRYRFLFANHAFERTTGVPVDQVVNRYVEEVIPEPSLSLVLGYYQQAIARVERVVWEETSDYPTGRVTGEVSVTPVCDAEGRVVQLVGVVHDVTRQKQVEEDLRHSNERFTYALRATSDALYEWDVATNTLAWGEGQEAFFGATLAAAPLPFPQWALSIHPQDRDRVVAGRQQVADDPVATVWQAEYRLRRADDTWVVVLDRGYLLRTPTGQALRMLGAVQDITARTQAEERLAQRNTELQQVGYLVSHNLRSPLANALGLTNLLQTEPSSSTTFTEAQAHLQKSLREFDEVLQDVTALLYRSEEPGVTTEEVPLEPVVAQVVAHLREAVAQAGGTARVSVPPGLRVRANRAYLYSIFFNLLTNALKYRSAQRPLHVAITAKGQPGQPTTIEVTDNGIGFDQQEVGDAIFQPFQRFHTDRPGRGLGLYLVKAHVESLNGQISVQSAPDEGTRFLLTFP